MHHLVFGINFQIHFVSFTSLVSIHFLIHLSTHLCYRPRYHHPSLTHTHTRLFDFSHFLIMGLLHSRLRTYLFNKSFPHKTSFIYWTASKCLRDNGTGLDLSRSSVYFLVSRFIIIFLFIPCGRHSWLLVSFLLHVKYSLSCRIVS